jgi:hypothetical protein
MNKWVGLELDERGFPFLRDVEATLELASARLNKSRSAVAGTTRQTESGNPWFDPTTGRFANGPAGVTVKLGGALLRNLLNASKRAIDARVLASGANGISAIPGDNGMVSITLYIDNTAIATFDVPSKEAEPATTELPQEPDPSEPEPPSSVPPGVDPEEWGRRLDAVREAAREFDPQAEEDLREFLKGRTRRELSEKEIEKFMEDVKRARLSDLVDVLDTSIRRRIAKRARGRRMVRVVPPRGYLRRTLAHLEDQDVAELHRRLEARGFSPEELESHLINRYPDPRREQIKSLVTDASPGANTPEE